MPLEGVDEVKGGDEDYVNEDDKSFRLGEEEEYDFDEFQENEHTQTTGNY